MSSIEQAKRIQEDLVSTRRYLHAHPEPNFAEYETSKYATNKLQSLGFTVERFSNHTGIVADLGSGDKTIAIRCDMDALPIAEQNNVIYRSTVPGVMHACGHDAHLACVLGAAQLLSQFALSCRVRIIVQPGDDPEGKPGAATMIECGALKDVSAILGLHVDATVPTNKIGIVASTPMPSAQRFIINVPEAGAPDDAALSSAKIVLALYDLVTQLEQCSITISLIHCTINDPHAGGAVSRVEGIGKTAGNLQKLQDAILNAVKSASAAADIEFLDPEREIINHGPVIAIAQQAAADLLGENNVLSVKRQSWNSQFSLLAQHAPGAMIYLGAEMAGNRRTHQTPTFDIDEQCLVVGTAVLTETVTRLTAAL